MGWGSGVGSRTTPPPAPRTEARGGRTQWGQPSRSTAVQARGMPELRWRVTGRGRGTLHDRDRRRAAVFQRRCRVSGEGSRPRRSLGQRSWRGNALGVTRVHVDAGRFLGHLAVIQLPDTGGAQLPPAAFEEGWLREGRWTGARGWIRGPRNRSAGTRPPAPARAPGGTAGAGQAAGNVRTADRRADGDADADDDHEGQERAGYGQAVSDRRAGDPSTPAHR